MRAAPDSELEKLKCNKNLLYATTDAYILPSSTDDDRLVEVCLA